MMKGYVWLYTAALRDRLTPELDGDLDALRVAFFSMAFPSKFLLGI